MKQEVTLLNKNKGFTLIEVLVSIVILSIIAVVSTNFLQSSVDAREESSNKLQDLKEFNIASSIVRRDMRQILIFTTLVNSSFSTSKVRRVEYLLIDDSLIRRQYFADNPYSYEEFFETNLLDDINDIEFSYLNNSKWYSEWPIDILTKRKIPNLIRITFTKNNLDYEWIINPNIDYVYKK